MKRALLILVSVTAACGPSGVDEGEQLDGALGGAAATLAEGVGHVHVKRANEAVWEEATVGSVFVSGDWIRATPGSYGRIEYVRGGRLEISDRALVVIDLTAPSAGVKERDSVVALESGTVAGVLGTSGKPLVIQTPGKREAKLRSSSSDVALHYRLSRKSNSTEVAVKEGVGILEYRGERRTLKGGEATELRDDEAPAAVVELLRAPRLLGPQPNARVALESGLPVEFAWEKPQGASSFRVQVAKDRAFLQLLVDAEQAQPLLSLTPQEAGVLYWRVAAADSGAYWSQFSETRSLRVDKFAVRDRLVEPRPQARIGTLTAQTEVAFAWETVEGAPSYRLVVSRDEGLRSPVVDEDISGQSHTARLPPGKYRWAVFAKLDRPLPLFLRPRMLVIERGKKSEMKIPKKLQSWGDR